MTHHEVSLWQTPEWEQFQKNRGHKTTRIDHVLILKYPIGLGLRYGYIPRAGKLTSQFFKDLEIYAKKKQLVFVRIDSEHEQKIPQDLSTKASHSSQPETTLIIDLTQSEADILKNMKRKGRYNISLAEKKGVVVKRAEKSDEQQEFGSIFYQLLQETSSRDKFSGHGESYYQGMLKELPMSEVFVAFYEEKPVAAAICTFQKQRAIYYYGSSSNEHREVMAPYLLQWEAIKEAKKRGCIEYDFLGIAPEGAGGDHPWKGITEFKLKFGGTVISSPRAQDIIFRPFMYKVYELLKALQKLIK